MISIDEIIELFDEVENGCEYGSLGVVVCEDGSYWFCKRDVEILSRDIEFRAANVQMQDALAKSLLDPEELFIAKEDERIQEKRMDLEQPKQARIESFNHDYYGSKQKIIDEVMPGAFDAPWGSDFSL